MVFHRHSSLSHAELPFTFEADYFFHSLQSIQHRAIPWSRPSSTEASKTTDSRWIGDPTNYPMDIPNIRAVRPIDQRNVSPSVDPFLLCLVLQNNNIRIKVVCTVPFSSSPFPRFHSSSYSQHLFLLSFSLSLLSEN